MSAQEWDEVPAVDAVDAAAKAAIEGTDVEDAGLSESFDSAGKVQEAAGAPVVPATAPAPTI